MLRFTALWDMRSKRFPFKKKNLEYLITFAWKPFLDILNPPAGKDKGQSSPLCCGCSTNALSETDPPPPKKKPTNAPLSRILGEGWVSTKPSPTRAVNTHNKNAHMLTPFVRT